MSENRLIQGLFGFDIMGAAHIGRLPLYQSLSFELVGVVLQNFLRNSNKTKGLLTANKHHLHTPRWKRQTNKLASQFVSLAQKAVFPPTLYHQQEDSSNIVVSPARKNCTHHKKSSGKSPVILPGRYSMNSSAPSKPYTSKLFMILVPLTIRSLS